MTPAAQKLDAHLAQAINTPKTESRMNKFQTIADGMAKRRKAWDERADKLLVAMAALDAPAEEAFKSHEGKLAEAEAGFRDMQASIRDLAGGNNPPVDSTVSVGSSTDKA